MPCKMLGGHYCFANERPYNKTKALGSSESLCRVQFCDWTRLFVQRQLGNRLQPRGGLTARRMSLKRRAQDDAAARLA